MKIKYVVTERNNAILLPSSMTHKDFQRHGIRSAGFCRFDWNPEVGRWEAKCWGESVSLGIKSTPVEDERAVEFLLNN